MTVQDAPSAMPSRATEPEVAPAPRVIEAGIGAPLPQSTEKSNSPPGKLVPSLTVSVIWSETGTLYAMQAIGSLPFQPKIPSRLSPLLMSL